MLHDLWHLIGGDQARFFPESASDIAGPLNSLSLYLLIFSLIFVIGIFALMVVFCVRYRRRDPDQLATEVHDNYKLETAWTLIPFAFIMVAFVRGGYQYLNMDTPPEGETVFVFAKQWMWKFEHENGIAEINELHVPSEKSIRLVMISQDVIHSFFIPEFRVKFDVLPGRYTRAWFHPTAVGTYSIRCSQYCGTDHSKMTGVVQALSVDDYRKWQAEMSQPLHLSATTHGRQLFEEKNCVGCHEGPMNTAPHLAGVFGNEVELNNGRHVMADEAYLRRSILDPNYEIVKGFTSTMPTYAGQLSEIEIADLISYIRSLKFQQPQEARRDD